MDDDAIILTAAVEQLTAQANADKKYRRYYDGNHDLSFATPKFRSTFGAMFSAFAENLCPTVVDEMTDRLTIESFVSDDGKEQQTVDDAMDIWRANRMDRRQDEVHKEAAKVGNAFLIVWPDEDNKPVFYPNQSNMMTVRYDPEAPGRVLWAAKWWQQDDKKIRLNLYRPDAIVKYITRNPVTDGTLPKVLTAFEPYTVEREPWPLTHEWGVVPVFHFGNNAGVGEFGRSELHDVIPLQDALNKSVADMMVGGEFVALPQRVITGWEPEIDEETGKPKKLPSELDKWLAFASNDVNVAQLPAADMSQFLDAQAKFRTSIAVVSRTPLHHVNPLSGQWPSGEALGTAESPLVKKVGKRQVSFGNVWEDAMTLALRMAGKEPPPLSANWQEAETRSDNDRVNRVVQLTNAGASLEGAMRVESYSDDQVSVATAVAVDGIEQ